MNHTITPEHTGKHVTRNICSLKKCGQEQLTLIFSSSSSPSHLLEVIVDGAIT